MFNFRYGMANLRKIFMLLLKHNCRICKNCNFVSFFNLLVMNSKIKGYVLGAIAAATYGTNPLFTLPLYAEGMNADNVLFFRYLFALPMVAAMLLWRKRNFRISGRSIVPLAVMGIMVSLSSLLLFVSYNYMDAGIASTLLFVYPLMVAVIMAIFFHERLSLTTMLCILMALVGIGLLFKGLTELR